MNKGHTTPVGRSVFYDLFPPEEAANLHVRAQLMSQLTDLLKTRFPTQEEAAEALAVAETTVSDLYRGKIQRFTVDMLINLLSRVGQSVEVHTRAGGMTEKELIERDSQRDLVAELLESVRQMKAGQKGAVHEETLYVMQNKSLMRQITDSLKTYEARTKCITDDDVT